MVVDRPLGEKICDLPRSSPVVYSLDGCLAFFRPVLEDVVKICTATKTSFSINTKVRKYEMYRFDEEVLIVRKTTIVPWEWEETVVPS